MANTYSGTRSGMSRWHVHDHKHPSTRSKQSLKEKRKYRRIWILCPTLANSNFSPGPLDSPPTVLQLRRWYRPQCGHRSARPNETPSVGTPGSWHGHVDRVGPCPRLLFRKNQKGSSWIKSDQTGKVQMAEFSCAAAVRKSASSSSKRWIWAFRNANTCHRTRKSFSALLCH